MLTRIVVVRLSEEHWIAWGYLSDETAAGYFGNGATAEEAFATLQKVERED